MSDTFQAKVIIETVLVLLRSKQLRYKYGPGTQQGKLRANLGAVTPS